MRFTNNSKLQLEKHFQQCEGIASSETVNFITFEATEIKNAQ